MYVGWLEIFELLTSGAYIFMGAWMGVWDLELAGIHFIHFIHLYPFVSGIPAGTHTCAHYNTIHLQLVD